MSLPALAVNADTRSITDRVNVLIRDYNNPPPLPISNSGSTTFLASDVALNNTSNFFDGPNTGSIGAGGQLWVIIGVANISDGNGAAQIEAALHDGTSYIANSQMQVDSATRSVNIAMVVVVMLTAPTTFVLRAKDQTSASGRLNATGAATAVANRATSITAMRLS